MILLANKLKRIVSETTSGRGTTTTTVTQEFSTVIFTLNVTALAANTSLDLKFFSIVDSVERELLHAPLVTKITPDSIEFTVQAGGDIRVDVAYNGAATYTIHAKSLANAPALETITVTESASTAEWQAGMLDSLQINNELMMKLVNHLRQITGVRNDDGESF